MNDWQEIVWWWEIGSQTDGFVIRLRFSEVLGKSQRIAMKRLLPFKRLFITDSACITVRWVYGRIFATGTPAVNNSQLNVLNPGSTTKSIKECHRLLDKVWNFKRFRDQPYHSSEGHECIPSQFIWGWWLAHLFSPLFRDSRKIMETW